MGRPKMFENKTVLSVSISRELKDEVLKYCYEKETNASELVRRLLQSYLLHTNN